MTTQTIQVSTNQEISRILQDPGTFATVLRLVLLDVYGPEVDDWTDDTLVMEVFEDYGVTLSDAAVAKIAAARGTQRTNFYQSRLYWFTMWTEALNGTAPNFEVVAMPDLEECAWGITESRILFDIDPEEEAWSPEIAGYCLALADSMGLETIPNALKPVLGKERDRISGYSEYTTDSPEMFAAEFVSQQNQALEIDSSVKEKLKQLWQQLSSISFRNFPKLGPEFEQQLMGLLEDPLGEGTKSPDPQDA